MKIQKRDGSLVAMKFDKITQRLKNLMTTDMKKLIDVDLITQKVIDSLYDGIKSTEIDNLVAETAVGMSTIQTEYEELAARLVASYLRKRTPTSFSDAMFKLYEHGIVSESLWLSIENIGRLTVNEAIIHSRDMQINFFGLKTLEKSYLQRINGQIVETPQYMWMRVALGIHGDNWELAKETYDAMSQGLFTHATPTLFNSGTPRPQLSSCFLISSKGDSIDSIYDTLKECAQISKWSGGIGLHIHDIRGSGAKIKGTNGVSDGIVPMLRVFNNTARYVNQGGGKRKGSFAVYLEPWHSDIEAFLELRLNQGDEEARCRDLFTALWIPDLFMERVERNEKWSLFSPGDTVDFSELYGNDFKEAYEKAESEGKAVKTVDAHTIWQKIIRSQVETGTPYMLYKDAVNMKNNQKNLGTIKSSNLCVAPETKILTSTGYHTIKELAGQNVEVWNGEEFSSTTIVQTGENQSLLTVTTTGGYSLRCTPYHKFYIKDKKDSITASELLPGMELMPLILPDGSNVKYVILSVEDAGEKDDTYCFNEPKKHMGVFNGILTGNCSEIVLFTSKEETAVCNLASIALPKFVSKNKKFDFAGLMDVSRIITRNLNKVIDINFYPTETAKRSNLKHRPIGIGVQGLADAYILMGYAFESDEAMELNKRIFETIYYGAVSESAELAKIHGPYESFEGSPASQGLFQFDMWEGETKLNYDWDSLRKKPLRNSMFLAPMPTASTSQILGNNECIEPYTSNMYLRRTLAGEFVIINKHLVKELTALGKWNLDTKNNIISNNGSVKGLDIPDEIKERYKNVWEISQKKLIDQAADRARFICQTQSLNLFLEDPTTSKISSMHMYSWKKGLKTGMYYLRTRPKARAIQFTIDPVEKAKMMCSLQNRENCEMCSS